MKDLHLKRRIKEPSVVSCLSSNAKSAQSIKSSKGAVADYIFDITTASCIFYEWTYVQNTFTGDKGTDKGFHFSLPGGLKCEANITAVNESYNESLKKPYCIQLIGGGEGVEGGVATAWDEDNTTLGVGEWFGGGISLGADAIVIKPKWK